MGPSSILYATFCAVVGSHPAHIATDECPTTAQKKISLVSQYECHPLARCLFCQAVGASMAHHVRDRQTTQSLLVVHRSQGQLATDSLSQSIVRDAVRLCLFCVRRWCQGQDRRLHRPSRVESPNRDEVAAVADHHRLPPLAMSLCGATSPMDRARGGAALHQSHSSSRCSGRTVGILLLRLPMVQPRSRKAAWTSCDSAELRPKATGNGRRAQSRSWDDDACGRSLDSPSLGRLQRHSHLGRFR